MILEYFSHLCWYKTHGNQYKAILALVEASGSTFISPAFCLDSLFFYMNAFYCINVLLCIDLARLILSPSYYLSVGVTIIIHFLNDFPIGAHTTKIQLFLSFFIFYVEHIMDEYF